MAYTINSHINTLKEVRRFFRYLIAEKHINFHPDDDFEDYLEDKSEANLYNRLMDECFTVCEQKEKPEMIYDIALEEFDSYIKKYMVK